MERKWKKIMTTFYVVVDILCLLGRIPLGMKICFNVMYTFFRLPLLQFNVLFQWKKKKFILFQWVVFFLKCFDMSKSV